MRKTYYSIRTILAQSEKEAIEKIESMEFDEYNPICDRVLTLEELNSELKKQ